MDYSTSWTSTKSFEIKCPKCDSTAIIFSVIDYGVTILIRCQSCEFEEKI